MGEDLAARPVGRPRPVATTGRFILRTAVQMARNRWYRFGYACVNFGSPASLRAYLADHAADLHELEKEARFERVALLARELMRAVGAVIPVLPVPLVATVIVRSGSESLSEFELKARVHALVPELESAGARVYVPRRDLDYAIAVGLRTLTLRRLVVERDGLCAPRGTESAMLRYYANAIAHLWGQPALEPAGR